MDAGLADRLGSYEQLLAELQAAVDDANLAVSKAEAIRKFVVLREDWTEEGGQITPSLKVKRKVVEDNFRSDIEEMYAS